MPRALAYFTLLTFTLYAQRFAFTMRLIYTYEYMHKNIHIHKNIHTYITHTHTYIHTHNTYIHIRQIHRERDSDVIRTRTIRLAQPQREKREKEMEIDKSDVIRLVTPRAIRLAQTRLV